MASIPNSAVPDAYTLSKQAFDDLITVTQAVTQLTSNHVIDAGSARDYINNFRAMLRGRVFHRTLNEFSMRYFFSHIATEYEPQALANALIALMEHTEYYEGVQLRYGNNVTMRANRSIYAEYLQLLPDALRDGLIQSSVETITQRTQTRDDIINDLKNLKVTDSALVNINGTAYSRDARTIAQIKLLRGYRCQLCQIRIAKKNGGFYIEAAHITPKHQQGRETPDNIMILCPNHHKEFDHGDVQNLTRTNEGVSFTMNGVTYSINLAIE